jgi:hypothetical protein
MLLYFSFELVSHDTEASFIPLDMSFSTVDCT